MPRNPFTDAGDNAVSGEPVTPRIRVTEINETNVVLAIELIDSNNRPVMTLNRACLRVGDTLSITDVVINLTVEIKK